MKSYELARRDLIAAGGLSIGMTLAARVAPANAQGGPTQVACESVHTASSPA